jgi:hypothetical protein
MSINIPVYYHIPNGVFTISKLMTIGGKRVQSKPTMIPVELYRDIKDRVVIAPMTQEYMTYLFGKKYFTNTIFEIDQLPSMSDDFIIRLAKKVGTDISRVKTHIGRAKNIAKAIRKRMGINGT